MAKFFKHKNALVEKGALIGEGTRVWAFCNIQKGAKVGAHCNICDGSFIEKGAVVGDHVTIKHNVSIFDGVTIGNNVFIASNIAFINDRFPRANRKDGCDFEKTVVKDGATLGANAVIMCGVTVGAYAMVGAGAVVTKDVADHALVIGNPARLVGYACQCGLPLNEKLECRCGKRFVKGAKGLTLNG
jgi:acetyltransferase-like isoleucine patch superfamily enzyme